MWHAMEVLLAYSSFQVRFIERSSSPCMEFLHHCVGTRGSIRPPPHVLTRSSACMACAMAPQYLKQKSKTPQLQHAQEIGVLDYMIPDVIKHGFSEVFGSAKVELPRSYYLPYVHLFLLVLIHHKHVLVKQFGLIHTDSKAHRLIQASKTSPLSAI